MGIRCADHVTPLYPKKLALTLPTGGGRSVGIVRSRTKATELFFVVVVVCVCTCIVSWFSGRQIPSFLRLIILSPLTCLAVPYLGILSQKRHDFRKNNVTEIKILCFYLFYIVFLIIPHSKKNSARYFSKFT